MIDENRCPQVCGMLLSENAEEAGLGVLVECERPDRHSGYHVSKAHRMSWTGKAEPREMEYAKQLRTEREGVSWEERILEETLIERVMMEHTVSIFGQCACGSKLSTYGKRNHSVQEVARHVSEKIWEAQLPYRQKYLENNAAEGSSGPERVVQ